MAGTVTRVAVLIATREPAYQIGSPEMEKGGASYKAQREQHQRRQEHEETETNKSSSFSWGPSQPHYEKGNERKAASYRAEQERKVSRN